MAYNFAVPARLLATCLKQTAPTITLAVSCRLLINHIREYKLTHLPASLNFRLVTTTNTIIFIPKQDLMKIKKTRTWRFCTQRASRLHRRVLVICQRPKLAPDIVFRSFSQHASRFEAQLGPAYKEICATYGIMRRFRCMGTLHNCNCKSNKIFQRPSQRALPTLKHEAWLCRKSNAWTRRLLGPECF